MFGFSGNRILSSTLKVVACVGLLSFAAVRWLSNGGLDQTGLARLAGNAVNDPLTTGSISSSRTGVKLDPCTLPRH